MEYYRESCNDLLAPMTCKNNYAGLLLENKLSATPPDRT